MTISRKGPEPPGSGPLSRVSGVLFTFSILSLSPGAAFGISRSGSPPKRGGFTVPLPASAANATLSA